MNFEVGKRYKTRDGSIVTITKIDNYIFITGGGYAAFPLFMSGRNSMLEDRPADLVSEVEDWIIGKTYTAKAPYYTGYKYQLVAINPDHKYPYVMRFGTSKLDLVGCFTEEQLRQRQLELPPTKVKVKLAFLNGALYATTTNDSFIYLPANAIIRDVEVEL